jgi:hypothetical protein
VSELGRYSVRRRIGGTWVGGDRWEVLYDGKNRSQCGYRDDVLPLFLSCATTRRGAMRKARKIVEQRGLATVAERVTDRSDPSSRIPTSDLRAGT